MNNIRGFIKLSESFYCAGQPTQEELADVQRAGVNLVVNLAMLDSDYALPDERAVVESLHMDFVHIPVPFAAPTVAHFVQFEAELLARPERHVLVHCALNWRASSFAALFAERHLGWSRQQADELRAALWSPNDVWTAWTNAVRETPTGEGIG